MEWLPLTLLCAFALASADALTKARLGGFSARELAFIRLSLAGLLVSPLLLLQPFPALPPAFWGWVLAAVPLEILAMLLYMKAIRDYPLSLTLPYLAFTPVFVILVGYLLLGERVSGQGLLGILLVVAGAWLLNFDEADGNNWRSWLEPLRAILRHPGSLLMLVVAFIYSFTAVTGKGAMQYMEPGLFGPFYFVLVGLALLPLLGLKARSTLCRIRRQLWPVLLTAGLMALMLVTHFLALQQVETAYMIAVKRTSLLFGILYGAWIFRETGLGHHLLAGTVMVAGVALIVLG
ncbi:EamA-like transporter family protein [Candidatus Endoriftia persephone str. Guaymas]|jgi:drug/metabolite transporter (DMT)-like permease|uniref:DMT family transporter n=1 Tax=Candidatus Endoriftia persephonae TaxID=393765 RepID=A0A9J6ZWI8_9GAMM|nr:DMT family transporter [Candidatus Endoriftia persephone]MBA1331557.1 EamA-like transporter family protein [Candidatus Endoriftia persephone str. Guaymas]USF87164.1 DMT family transporter [Candidatus Endoriftia persephone]